MTNFKINLKELKEIGAKIKMSKHENKHIYTAHYNNTNRYIRFDRKGNIIDWCNGDWASSWTIIFASAYTYHLRALSFRNKEKVLNTPVSGELVKELLTLNIIK